MPKPKPKYDAKTGKWVVKNWDGTVAGVQDGENRSFDNLNNSLATPGASSSGAIESSNTGRTSESESGNHPPFAKIDGVADSSPALEAGLKEGDLITEFGSINHSNHQNLRGLMPVVNEAADAQQAICIKLLRPIPLSLTKESVEVQLTPKPWPGRGLIGCHIVPYSDSLSGT